MVDTEKQVLNDIGVAVASSDAEGQRFFAAIAAAYAAGKAAGKGKED